MRELLRFDSEGPPGERLRVWDRVAEDLVERAIEEDRAESFVLTMDGAPVYWVASSVDGVTGLRLARDPEGSSLILSAEEALGAAEARVRELEEELAHPERRLR